MIVDEGTVQFQTLAAASVSTPPTGSCVLFFDASNGNHLSQKDSSGSVIDLTVTGGGGGGLTKGTATLDFGKSGSDLATVTVPNTSVAALSQFIVNLSPIGTVDNDADEHFAEPSSPKVTSRVNGMSFDISMQSDDQTRLFGTWLVDWAIIN